MFKVAPHRIKSRINLCLIGAMFLFPSFAMATDRTDITIGLRTLPMLDNAVAGTVTMAVVFDPDVPESKADAENIKSIIDGGLQAPEGISKLSAVLVPATDMKALAGLKLAFVASGSGKRFDDIAKAATTEGVLTISTELQCVRDNKCILGIISKPVIEIYYSRAASDAAKVGFDPAFTMLIKKV